MSSRYLIKNNKNTKRGISPVIATVILVAVAVVIAAALAGFSSSLFGSYSSAGSAVTTKSMSLSSATGDIDFQLTNGGNVADELVSISIPPNAPLAADAADAAFTLIESTTAGGVTTVDSFQVPPGGELHITADMGNGGAIVFEEGKQITVRMTMESGLQITQSVIVIA